MEVLRSWRPHLLVIEGDRVGDSLPALVAQAGAYALCIAFLWSEDPRQRARLLDHHPVGILPRDYDRGDLNSLLAAVRSIADIPAAESERATEVRLGLVGLACAVIAAAVGFALPGAAALVQGGDHKPYYLVLGLALISIVLLLRLKRPVTAAVQAALIGLVTLLPTQA
ncbi:hypothetical protein [Phenylobacterium sp. J367]|uniref:hypothetical protein n=1 Tax=Phenylobacterium sp. J367 TaxID=2898435 RepID=UPI002150B2B1|nr:hypothetical protein [Phenylobacterium sp. J367]MCR5879638.1 hypothetical protein [Phenylobacterium sp. J367]